MEIVPMEQFLLTVRHYVTIENTYELNSLEQTNKSQSQS